METISRILLTFLLNAVWQIPLIVVVALVGDWLLRQTTARVRHSLWVLTLFLCLGLPVLSVVNSSSDVFNRPKSAEIIKNQTAVTELPTEIIENQEIEQSSPIQISALPAVFLICCYFATFVYGSFRLWRAWRRTQIVVRKSVLSEPPPEIAALADECREIFEVKNIRVFCSPDVHSPMTVGAFNPLIILPAKLNQETNRHVLLSAIGHELAHVKRRDYLLNLFYEFLNLPFFFHPAMIWVKRRIKETRELRCDEMVTERLVNAADYAQSLVYLTESAIGFSRPVLTLGMNDGNILENRIMKLLQKTKLSPSRRNLLIFAACFLLATAVATAVTYSLRPVLAQKLFNNAEKQKIVLSQEIMNETDKKKFAELQDELVRKKAAIEKEQEKTKLSDEDLQTKPDLLQEDQAELAQQTKITMPQAIEIASQKQSGTVMDCKLMLSAETKAVFYYVGIMTNEHRKVLVIVNAADGTIKDTQNTQIN